MAPLANVLLPLVASVISLAHAATPIKWSSCGKNTTIPYTCGTLSVPLDYSDPRSNKTLDLALVKVDAVKQPRKGSILFNPGGPGNSGRNLIAGSSANSLRIMTGGQYDLIGFDPRGTGNTIPFSCYPDELSKTLANAVGPQGSNSSDTALATLWAARGAYADTCFENAGPTGELISTAFVARDMMQIVDALNEDGLLRYWGISYGTLLGATVAAMFPNKIDKMVLDGVVNPHEYYAGREVEGNADTEGTLAGFFSGCLAAPDLCALASKNATVAGLTNQFYKTLDDLKYNPIQTSSNVQETLTYDLVKGAVMKSLYGVSTWPVTARMLNNVYTGNYTGANALVGLLTSSGGDTFDDSAAADAISGIRCGEANFRTDKLADVLPTVKALYAMSPMGGDASSQLPITCSQWSFNARERYSGNFQTRTKNPMLIVNNKFDPVTPLVSAQNVSAGFDGSVVLAQNGYGHATLSQPSTCVARAIRTYFTNGILPAKGTICDSSVPPFSLQTGDEILTPLANVTKRSADIDDDATLLAAATSLGRAILPGLKRM